MQSRSKAKKLIGAFFSLTGRRLGAVFATENHIGGGADFAELSLIGCLLVQKERARIFGSRIAKKTVELFGM